MGRKPSVDKAAVLDAAQRIVDQEGASALSIGAVAAAAGISKGGVQSAFGTKDDLIAAMLDRWLKADDAEFARLSGEYGPIRGHVQATRKLGDNAERQITNLMAALMSSPTHTATVRDWYRARFGDLSAKSASARLALLASEGAYYLRFLGLVEMSPAEWRAIFDDIETLAGKPS